jgi:hypothetical protein
MNPISDKVMPPLPIRDRSLREITLTTTTKLRLVLVQKWLARPAIVHSVALSAKCETDFVGNVVRNMLHKRTKNDRYLWLISQIDPFPLARCFQS